MGKYIKKRKTRKNTQEKLETDETKRGNTDSLCPLTEQLPYEEQTPFWFFTYNNYTPETLETLKNIFEHECKWYVFQEETASTGTIHLQGNIALHKKQRLSYIIKFNHKIHWKPTKAITAAIAYSTKYETRTGKIYAKGIDVPEQVKTQDPYGWQLQVMDIIKQEPDDRTIYWFWETKGQVGKTKLCKHLVLKHDALMLNGKGTDMFHMLSKFPRKRKIILCDIPRCSFEYINYAAIEQIKNGLVFSGKYEGCQMVFNCPHVIVFANEQPNYVKLSLDRWKVVEIGVNDVELGAPTPTLDASASTDITYTDIGSIM